MSWDVVVVKFDREPPALAEDLTDDWQEIPLGSPQDVRDAISASLPEVEWSHPEDGAYLGDGFSFAFRIGPDDPVTSLMVQVRGEGDPISALLQITVPNHWVLIDCSTGEFLTPENPSQSGWEGFQALRDRAINHPREEE